MLEQVSVGVSEMEGWTNRWMQFNCPGQEAIWWNSKTRE